MSDWIPVPEIENVLIILARLSDLPEEIAEAPVMPLLDELKSWNGGSVYVFHDPPEAGEVLEDADPEMAARFALAAQMTDHRAEVCRDALRRVFSRATVQRVVLVNADHGDISVDQINGAFAGLQDTDIFWAGEWPGRFILGMRTYHGELFSDLNAAQSDLRNIIHSVTAERSLTLQARDLP